MLTHRAKFLELVKQEKIIPSLKSYSDSLLFYYIGNLAVTNNAGSLFEIGVGGSTYPLVELSEQHHRKFVVVDIDATRLHNFANLEIFKEAELEHYHINSNKLPATSITDLLYCHIDSFGSKDYNTTIGDLEFCIKHLVFNGLICQDDYGNNKCSTVTDAVQTMIHTGQLVMLLVGDSSCWLTKPEYYDYWMEQFATDKEFTILAPFLNIRQSDQLHKHPNYLFMQAIAPPESVTDNAILNFYNSLLNFNHEKYLQMPYQDLSMIGSRFRKKTCYVLWTEWNNLRGPGWPESAPSTKGDIDNLPEWVKKELKNIHQITDLYATTDIVRDHCWSLDVPV
jgi:hypothetical protein